MGLRSLKRQQMRKTVKEAPTLAEEYKRSVRSLNAVQTIAGAIQNGITPKMLEEQYKKGYEEGKMAVLKLVEQEKLPYVQVFCAAMCLALHEHYGFAAKRLARVIAEAIDTTNNGLWLSPDEYFEEVRRVCNLDLGPTFVDGGMLP